MEQIATASEFPLNSKPVNPNFFTGRNESVTPLRQRTGFALLAFFVWIASTAFIVVVPAVFFLPYLASKGVALNDRVVVAEFVKNDTNAVLLQLAAIIPAHLLTILLAWVVITQGRKYAFLPTFGMSHGGVRWWHYVAILVGFFVCAAVVQSVMPEQENDLLRILKSSRYAAYLIAIIATFSAPFVEEIIYRGILYSTFKRAFGVPVAFALVTLLFALVHVPQYYPSYSTIILLTLLSVTLTGLRVVSNNLLPCIILHTIFNGLQSIVIVLEPYISGQKPEVAPGLLNFLQ
jgi:membrane protease YdiL (CAAX protease family)